MRKIILEDSWKDKLFCEFEQEYMITLSKFLRDEIKRNKIIYPRGNKIFNALNKTKLEEVKVVILGQDPYHGEGQAHGLSFSVEKGVKIPPSLKNILKELETDLGIKKPLHGNLENWCRQGVLLLNSVLTVEKSKPGSHGNKGWEKFTDKILFELSLIQTNKVFILWGRKAQAKVDFLNHQKSSLIIQSAHPSPYSAHTGFFGSKPFSRANQYLKKYNIKPIDWNLAN